MKLILPANLDLENKIAKYPPQNVKGFKIEKLQYFLSLILSVPAINDELNIVNGFVPLSSKLLKKRDTNYIAYFNYAIDLDLIECDNIFFSFDHDKKCLGYRFKEDYSTSIDVKSIDTKFNVQLSKKEKNEKARSCSNYQYITNNFYANDIQFDYETAIELSEEVYSSKLSNYEIREDKIVRDNYGNICISKKDPQLQYISEIYSIDRIANKEWSCGFIGKNHRFYHTIATMPGRLRNLLTINGENLISLDLKNAQPYGSLKLFDPNFYFSNDKYSKNKKNQNPWNRTDNWHLTDRHLKHFLTNSQRHELQKNIQNFSEGHFFHSNINKEIKLKQLHTNYTKDIFINKDSIIMWQSLMNLTECQDVELFSKLVSEGRFYEYMIERVGDEYFINSYKNRDADQLTFKDKRNLMKILMFQVLFSSNRFYHQKAALPKRKFKEHFPNVYEIFKFFKCSRKNLLALVLQSIESYLFLDVICKRITKELPGVPIIPIHDCIITTVGNEDAVHKIMEEELTSYIGLAPTIGKEYLNKEKYLDLNKKYLV